MTETRYPSPFGDVIKRYHPLRCSCGCKGGRLGDRERWTVVLEAVAPYTSTQVRLWASNHKAMKHVEWLRRFGNDDRYRAR